VQFVRLQGKTGLEDHTCQNLLFGQFRRHREYRRFQHFGICVDGIFDFHRRDVLAAATYRVFQPVDKIVVAVGVSAQQVAAMQPEIAPRGQRFRRPAPVTRHHDPRNLGADRQFSGDADGNFLVVFIDEPDLEPLRPDLATGLAIRRGEAR
jgi:hypothetical protein